MRGSVPSYSPAFALGEHQSDRTADRHLFYLLASLALAQFLMPVATHILMGEKTWHTPWMVTLSYFLALASLVVVVSRFSRARVLPAWPLLTLGSLLGLRLVLQFVHTEVTLERLVPYTTTALVFLALWLLAPKPQWFVIFAYAGVFVAVLSLGWGALAPDSGFYGQKELSWIPGVLGAGRSLSGPFANPNTLGAALALSFPFTFLLSGRTFRLLSATVILLTLLLSNSRTSMIAVAAAISLVVFLRYTRASDRLRVAVATGAMALAATASLAVPMLSTGPRAFTGRGRIWQETLLAWKTSPVIGNGFRWHPGYGSTHNIPLQILAQGGLVWFFAVLAVLALGVLVARRDAAAGSYVPAAYLVSLVLVGLAESVPALLAGNVWFALTGFIFAAILTGTGSVGVPLPPVFLGSRTATVRKLPVSCRKRIPELTDVQR